VLRNPRAMGGRSLGHYFRQQLVEFALAVRGLPNRCVQADDAARGIDLIDRVLASARANSAGAIDPAPDQPLALGAQPAADVFSSQ
jgi:UDP-N-acetyl-2-amino-2-deoxyglucuronate dehydrogenase